MIKCDGCPCLQKGYAFYCGELASEWWFCGVDESDIADHNVLRKDVKVKICPIAEIKFKDGTVYRPEL